MTILDERVTIWRIAVLTEDLDRSERAALRHEAERLEREWNKLTSSNLEKRLAKKGPLDLFALWDEGRRGQHAQWWERFTARWNLYQQMGRRGLEPQGV